MSPEFFRTISIFQDLSAEEAEFFHPLFEMRQVAPRARLIAEGAPMHEFFIVCAGTAHARRLAQKREVLLGRIGPGGFFGEVNLYDEGAATASVYAMDQVTVAVAGDAALRECMAAHPAAGCKVLSRLLNELSRRLRQTNERFVHSMYWSNLNAPQPA